MTFQRKKKLLEALKKSLGSCIFSMKTFQESRGWKELKRSEKITKILSRIDHRYPYLVAPEFLSLVEECQELQTQLEHWLKDKQEEIQSEWISTEIQRKIHRYLFDGTIL